MRILLAFIILIAFIAWIPSPVFAATTNPEIAQFTTSALNVITVIASLVATLFMIQGGYTYITSAGKPDALEHAKKTIRNALIGLALVLSANTIVSLLTGAFTTPSIPIDRSILNLTPLEPVTPTDGLAQVLSDAIASLLQNIIQSATRPITDGIINFLTTTPVLASNSVIFNFWLIILGITDSLFALLIALLGFQFMSASTFGFEELELKKLLPRIGLAFLGANTSIFIIDWIVRLANVMVTAILNATGGLNKLWIANAFNPASISVDQVAMITLIFMVLFLILAVVLLLFYITRLITIALGTVLAPLICLLWAIPKFSDFAEICAKSYLVTIFSIFVHVVIIQLAASFLTLPGQIGNNSLISILVGVGLLLALLKTQSAMVQMMFYNSGRSMIQKVGGQLMNVMSSRQTVTPRMSGAVRAPRKVVNA
ncbi:MAG: pilin [Candidatus Woesebacteria bacterium]